MKLFELKKYGDHGFSWKVYNEENADYANYQGREYLADEYRTNKQGDGLWINEKQERGTCQYSACETASGQRKKILREFEKENA